MPCKYLDPDIAKIVRCTFTDNRVCKQWRDEQNVFGYANEESLLDAYKFCEKQVRTFIPAPVGDTEKEE